MSYAYESRMLPRSISLARPIHIVYVVEYPISFYYHHLLLLLFLDFFASCITILSLFINLGRGIMMIKTKKTVNI